MQYLKLKSGRTIIELHNNWLGVETVLVNGHVVSKKSSVMGTEHYFTVIEGRHQHKYILTTRLIDSGQVVVDLHKNGLVEHYKIPVKWTGIKAKKTSSKSKKKGIALLQEYDLNAALELLQKANKKNTEDPEIYFYMACAYSLQENDLAAYKALKNAFANGFKDTQTILEHEMLAYVRIHDAFEAFFESGFTKFDKKMMQSKPEPSE